MKKFYLTFALGAVIGLGIPTKSYAQASAELIFPENSYACSVNAVSPSGEWIIGSKTAKQSGSFVTSATEGFIYNTKTLEVVEIKDADKLIMKFITDNGTAVYQKGDGFTPYIYKDGKETPIGNVTTLYTDISADGNTLVGFTSIGAINKAIIVEWDENNNKWVTNYLPLPEKSALGGKVNSFKAIHILKDKNSILGMGYQYLEAYSSMFKWTRENGEWICQEMFKDLCYNTEMEAPGETPVEGDYVTAKPGTAEYEDQKHQFQQVMKEYGEKADAYVKADRPFGYTSGFSFSNNDKYATISGGGPTYFDPSFSGYLMRWKIFNFETGEYYQYEEPVEDIYHMGGSSSLSITDEGTVFGTYARYSSIPSTFVTFAGGKPMELHDMIKKLYGLDLSEDMGYYMGKFYNIFTKATYEIGDTIVTGSAAHISADGTLIAGTHKNGDTDATEWYYIKLSSNPDQITAVTETQEPQAYLTAAKELVLPQETDKVEIFSVAGTKLYQSTKVNTPLNLENWNKGIYLVRIKQGNKYNTQKISL